MFTHAMFSMLVTRAGHSEGIFILVETGSRSSIYGFIFSPVRRCVAKTRPKKNARLFAGKTQESGPRVVTQKSVGVREAHLPASRAYRLRVQQVGQV
jgi:hypothetical protein